MSIVSAFMTQTIDYIKSVTVDGRNNKTLSIRYTDVTCRWSPGEKRILLPTGEFVSVAIEAWIPEQYDEVAFSDIIIKDEINYQIVRKDIKYDLMGNLDHIKLYLV